MAPDEMGIFHKTDGTQKQRKLNRPTLSGVYLSILYCVTQYTACCPGFQIKMSYEKRSLAKWEVTTVAIEGKSRTP